MCGYRYRQLKIDLITRDSPYQLTGFPAVLLAECPVLSTKLGNTRIRLKSNGLIWMNGRSNDLTDVCEYQGAKELSQ